MNASFHHVNVTVPRALEAEAKHFYGVVMALEEVPKPESSRGRGGAWYQLGEMQLHLSIEEGLGENCISKRHVCYTVSDLADAERAISACWRRDHPRRSADARLVTILRSRSGWKSFGDCTRKLSPALLWNGRAFRVQVVACKCGSRVGKLKLNSGASSKPASAVELM